MVSNKIRTNNQITRNSTNRTKTQINKNTAFQASLIVIFR